MFSHFQEYQGMFLYFAGFIGPLLIPEHYLQHFEGLSGAKGTLFEDHVNFVFQTETGLRTLAIIHILLILEVIRGRLYPIIIAQILYWIFIGLVGLSQLDELIIEEHFNLNCKRLGVLCGIQSLLYFTLENRRTGRKFKEE